MIISIIQPAKAASSSHNKPFSPDSYFKTTHTADDTIAALDSICEPFKESLSCSTFSIGKSAEKRALKILKVGRGTRRVFVMATLHGREWIAPLATQYALHDMMTKAKSGDTELSTLLLDQITLFVLPLVNPDGYQYTRTPASQSETARQWRKNRRLLPCKGEKCVHGIDLNRNWGIADKTFGFGATRATSDVYQGKRPFSEPELLAIKTWLLADNFGSSIGAILDVHCCAGVILPPSYYHGESDRVRKEHLDIAGRIAKSMSLFSKSDGVVYGHREREREFGPTNSGISVDWLFGESGAKLAFIVETRPANRHASKKLEGIFDVDAKYISQIGMEVEAAIKQVVSEVVMRDVDAHAATTTMEVAGTLSPIVVTTTPPLESHHDIVVVERVEEEPQREKHAQIPVEDLVDAPVLDEADQQQQHQQLTTENEQEELLPPPPPPDEEGANTSSDDENVVLVENEDEDGLPPPPPPPPDATQVDDDTDGDKEAPVPVSFDSTTPPVLEPDDDDDDEVTPAAANNPDGSVAVVVDHEIDELMEEVEEGNAVIATTTLHMSPTIPPTITDPPVLVMKKRVLTSPLEMSHHRNVEMENVIVERRTRKPRVQVTSGTNEVSVTDAAAAAAAGEKLIDHQERSHDFINFNKMDMLGNNVPRNLRGGNGLDMKSSLRAMLPKRPSFMLTFPVLLLVVYLLTTENREPVGVGGPRRAGPRRVRAARWTFVS